MFKKKYVKESKKRLQLKFTSRKQKETSKLKTDCQGQTEALQIGHLELHQCLQDTTFLEAAPRACSVFIYQTVLARGAYKVTECPRLYSGFFKRQKALKIF